MPRLRRLGSLCKFKSQEIKSDEKKKTAVETGNRRTTDCKGPSS